jgi:hypothetical protein
MEEYISHILKSHSHFKSDRVHLHVIENDCKDKTVYLNQRNLIISALNQLGNKALISFCHFILCPKKKSPGSSPGLFLL